MKRTKRLVLLLVISCAILACQTKAKSVDADKPVVNTPPKRQDTITMITPDALFQKMHEKHGDFIVVDVREEKEYREGHIAGALSIPWNQLRTRYTELDKTKRIIVYCKGGIQSQIASTMLIHNMYAVSELAGGVGDWQKKKYPMVMGASPYDQAK